LLTLSRKDLDAVLGEVPSLNEEFKASRQNPVVNSGRIADEGEFVDILGPAQSPDSVNSPFAEASG
jgi:hypothetical protein